MIAAYARTSSSVRRIGAIYALAFSAEDSDAIVVPEHALDDTKKHAGMV